MPTLIDTIELISKTMDELIDFVVIDEFLSLEFENYLEKNNVQIERESQLNDILIDYIIEGRISNGKRVLDYFLEKKPNADKNIVSSLKESFVTVFKINKISKNSYDAVCLVKNKEYTLLPLVKTTSLRGIGRFDFIKARIIKIGENFYILEIFDTINSYMEQNANIEAVASIIKNPEIAPVEDGFRESVLSFYESFKECFNDDEVILSNKETDRVLDEFYLFHTGKIDKVNYENYVSNLKYFEIPEFKNNFITNTKIGFGAGDAEYDIGLFYDKNLGLFVIPFLGTINALLNGEKVQNAGDALLYFLLSNKVPSSLLMKKGDKFLRALDENTDLKFKNIDEIIELYKPKSLYSPINILFNSQIFSKVLGYNKEIKENKTVGRNDPCPCGSGKKYKKCCLLKQN